MRRDDQERVCDKEDRYPHTNIQNQANEPVVRDLSSGKRSGAQVKRPNNLAQLNAPCVRDACKANSDGKWEM